MNAMRWVGDQQKDGLCRTAGKIKVTSVFRPPVIVLQSSRLILVAFDTLQDKGKYERQLF